MVDNKKTTQEKQWAKFGIDKLWISHESDDWSRLMNVTFFRKLNNLRTLHLTFYIFSSLDDIRELTIADIEPISATKMLSLNDVTLVIVEYSDHEAIERWTISKKREVAKEFRENLLDPKGETVFTAERRVESGETQMVNQVC